MPYSVSIPITRRTLIRLSLVRFGPGPEGRHGIRPGEVSYGSYRVIRLVLGFGGGCAGQCPSGGPPGGGPPPFGRVSGTGVWRCSTPLPGVADGSHEPSA